MVVRWVVGLFVCAVFICAMGRAHAACSPTPLDGCRRPIKRLGAVHPNHKDRLLIRDKAVAGRDYLEWRWVMGEATTTADYGNPLTTDAYGICIYQGTPATRIFGTTVPPGSAWERSGRRSDTVKLSYRDPEGSVGGLERLVLAPGKDKRASIKLSMRGPTLTLPSLPLALPALVQVVNEKSGLCWESDFPGAWTNRSDLFWGRPKK